MNDKIEQIKKMEKELWEALTDAQLREAKYRKEGSTEEEEIWRGYANEWRARWATTAEIIKILTKKEEL